MATVKCKQKGRLATKEVLDEIKGDFDSELREITNDKLDP